MSFVGHLDPDESLGEILAGLIMVLTFTLAAGVATRGAQDGVRTLLIAAVGCNLAWGIIDAVFYVMTNAFVRRRRARLFRAVSAAASEDAALATIRHELDPELEAITRPEHREQLYRGIHVLLANGKPLRTGVNSRRSHWRLRHLLSRVRHHAARRIAVPFRPRSVACAAHLEPASDRLRLHRRFPLGAIHQRQPMAGRPCAHRSRPGAGRHRDGPGRLTPARTPFAQLARCLGASSANRKNERATQAGAVVSGLAAAARRERPRPTRTNAWRAWCFSISPQRNACPSALPGHRICLCWIAWAA